MPVKDVTELRKAGNYQEALQRARADIEQEQNCWTKRSLFWSLRDFCENVLLPQGDTEQVSEYLDEMELLIPDIRDEKGHGARACKKLRIALVPQYDEIKELNELSKEDPIAAYSALDELSIDKIDVSLHNDIGWILYRYIKAKMSDQATIRNFEFTEITNKYLCLQVERPSILHSIVLAWACRYAEDNTGFDIIEFFYRWNPQNLRKEDYIPDKSDESDIVFPSLAEKCASVCFRRLKMISEYYDIDDDYKQMVETVKTWMVQYYKASCETGTPSETCLRNYAQICSAEGDMQKARQTYGKLILNNDKQPYIWNEFATLADDNSVRIGMLLKARNLPVKEDFKGNIHLDLAKVLIEEGYKKEAEKELNVYYATYFGKRWSISNLYERLKQDCEQLECDRDSLDEAHYVELAENYAYSNVADKKVCNAVVDNVNEKLKLFHLLALKDVNKVIKYKETTLRPSVGDVLKVVYVRNDKGNLRIINLKMAEEGDERLSKVVEGNIRLFKRKRTDTENKPNEQTEGPDYGFVDGVYIHKSIIKRFKITIECHVVAKAIICDDGRWKCVDLKKK